MLRVISGAKVGVQCKWSKHEKGTDANMINDKTQKALLYAHPVRAETIFKEQS